MMTRKPHSAEFDVAIIGGGLVGAINALTLRQRGYSCVVLESRPPGREQKIVVGEAVTEGTSLYLRHELGLEPWFKANTYRKYGFDFFTLPPELPKGRRLTMEDCHELLLSQQPLENIPTAYQQLIPTYHVERPGLNEHVAELARKAGAAWRTAAVEQVELGEGDADHVVHYESGGQLGRVTARWVLDCSGRKRVLGRQLGIQRDVPEPTSAAVWNRFSNVEDDARVWTTFHGIDRRRHTIHFTGRGFWMWWIHQADDCTSVGITWDKTIHDVDVKRQDHGFFEMAEKFPVVADLLRNAVAKEPYQYYAHLPYKSDHWISHRRYALIGDAAWFTDALYSIGLESSTRMTVFTTHAIEREIAGMPEPRAWFDRLNQDFDFACRTVAKMNHFKFRHGWHDPYVVASTVLYETAEIGPLYQMQKKRDWTWENQQKYYRLQFSSQERMDHLDRFLAEALAVAARHPHPDVPLLKKALLPGPIIYRFTWALWNVPGLLHYFFRLIRAWGYYERMSQKHRRWPDALTFMAGRRARDFLKLPVEKMDHGAPALRRHAGV